jgi:biotin carboxyl carrier protein
MPPPSSRSAWLLLAAGLLASGCSIPGDDQALSRVAFRPAADPIAQPGTTASSIVEEAPLALSPVPASTTTVAPEPPTSAATSRPVVATVPAPTAPAPAPPTTTAAPRPRVVVEQAWTPFAAAGGVTLSHPSSRVERVGFHQSNHEGAQQLEPLPAAVAPATMEARHRLTGSRTAADVVIDPAVEVRAPVSGTVKRAGTYVLYCEHSDDFVVIEPDARPGWEVKVLHIDGVQVAAGDRVMAGETVIAGGPTPLPFESQVDELTTAATAWPHVHIEVIDLAIPDIPSPGGGC